MSEPKKETPSRIEMEPLTENELGEVEGGFTEMPSSDGDAGDINFSCPGEVKNWSQCGDQVS